MYNLDVIIPVGYRVKSHRGTQFRIRATTQLREYLIKGFVQNDERIKATRHTDKYFDELQERIRDIPGSEKIFYAKIKDIYTTAIDYDLATEESLLFFKTAQLIRTKSTTKPTTTKKKNNQSLVRGLTIPIYPVFLASISRLEDFLSWI